jgi:hypothetical protein
MVPVFLQRGALQYGPPGRRPVSLADSGPLPQEKSPDADRQGGLGLGRLTHAQTPDGAVGFAGFALCACALSLPRCSSYGRYGRKVQEERCPFSPPPLATRRRYRARGPPQRSCRWCACSLCHAPYDKGCRFVRVSEKIRKIIPVLTLRALCAHRPSCYIRVQTSASQLLAMSGSLTLGFAVLLAPWIRGG